MRTAGTAGPHADGAAARRAADNAEYYRGKAEEYLAEDDGRAFGHVAGKTIPEDPGDFGEGYAFENFAQADNTHCRTRGDGEQY